MIIQALPYFAVEHDAFKEIFNYYSKKPKQQTRLVTVATLEEV